MTATRTVPRIHFVGRRNAGKTTLVCDLVRCLTSQGLRIATVKHTHHNHELDTPGKDSWLHRAAGAAAVGILSPHLTALYVPEERDDLTQNRYARFESAFSDCDLIVVEGDLHTDGIRIEVWRSAVTEPPYATADSTIAALISDTAIPELACPVWERNDIERIADHVRGIALP